MNKLELYYNQIKNFEQLSKEQLDVKNVNEIKNNSFIISIASDGRTMVYKNSNSNKDYKHL